MSLCTVRRNCNVLWMTHIHPLSSVTKLHENSFSTSTAAASKQQAKYIRNFFSHDGKERKRRVWHSNPEMQNPVGLSKQQVRGEGNNQRLHRLNKVFMEKISDAMSTGEVSSQLSGFGLEISKVRVLPDMRGVNIYWICSGRKGTDMRVADILAQNASSIRHELCQLSVLGRVPTITFVADHRFHKVAEVERRLAIADFGPDFMPTDASHHLKRELILRTTLSDHLHKDLSESSNSALNVSMSSASVEPQSLPPMRQDILGVDTHKIYDMVRKKVTKARAEHRLQQDQQNTADASNTALLDYDPDSVNQRTKEIRLWVDQYEQEKKKKERRLRRKEQQNLNVPREMQTYDQDINLDIYNEDDYEDNDNENYDHDYERI